MPALYTPKDLFYGSGRSQSLFKGGYEEDVRVPSPVLSTHSKGRQYGLLKLRIQLIIAVRAVRVCVLDARSADTEIPFTVFHYFPP